MEENNTPESIYSFQSKSGNESAALYGEFNADNLTVTETTNKRNTKLNYGNISRRLY